MVGVELDVRKLGDALGQCGRARRWIFDLKQLLRKSIEVMNDPRHLLRRHPSPLGHPMGGHTQHSLRLGGDQAVEHLREGILLDGVHRRAMPDEEGWSFHVY